MRRACVALVAVVACDPWIGTVRRVGTANLAVQPAEVGPTRLVGFVTPGARPREDAGASFAMVLAGGDWLAVVDDALVRMSPDGRVRWSRTGVGIWDSLAGPAGQVIAVGDLADASAPNGARRALFAIDVATGRQLWSAVSDPVTRTASARLARAGSITVAATAYGETGVDDAGRVVWTASHLESFDDALVATLDPTTVAVAQANSFSTADIADEPRHFPLVVRTLDATTGAERGRVELPAAGDHFALGQLAVAGGRRIAIQCADIRVHGARGETADHKPQIVVTQDAVAEVVVVGATDVAHPVARALAMPAVVEAPLRARLAPDEVAFLDRYATGTATLGLTVVDLTSARARRAVVMRPRHVDIGDGLDSFVQVTQLARDGDRLTFAGIYAGTVEPLRAVVREMDECAAAGHIECSEGRGKVTLAPFAGLIGTIELTR